MPCWDETSYPSELVPLCATVRNVSNEDEQGWKTVEGRKETNAPIETQIMMMEVNSAGGTVFDALEVTMNSEEDFPVLMADVQNGAAKQTRTIMQKMPKKGSQAKANQENRTHGEVAMVGRTVPTFAKIGPSGMRETHSRGGDNYHPLLGVAADDNDDKLCTERAKETREIAVPRRASMCTPTADRQAVARLDAWMAVSRTDCGLRCGRNCPSAYVGARPCDTRNGCIAQRTELRVSHRRPHPAPRRTETAALDTRRELEGNDVSGTSGSGTRLGCAALDTWWFSTTTAHHGLVSDAK